jgi:hypothetical protein
MLPKLKHNKIEDNPKYRAILDAADREAEEECKDSKGQMGHCHAVWGAKKRILADKYHLKWKSPA